MSDLNDILNYKKARARLQVAIKYVLRTKYKDEIGNNDEKWKFLSLDNYHWNYPVKKTGNIADVDNDKIIENIANLHNNTEIQTKINTLYQELLQHKLDTYPRHTQKGEKHDSEQIRKDQVKELNASLFFHDPKNVGHSNCLICEMYQGDKKQEGEPMETETETGTENTAEAVTIMTIETLRKKIDAMFTDKAKIETTKGEVKKIDSLLLKRSNVDDLTQSSLFKDLEENSNVSNLDPEVVISEIQERIQTNIDNLFYNDDTCTEDKFLHIVGVLHTIAETNPAFVGNKAGEFVYPVHRKGETDKPDVVSKAESLDTIIQEKPDDKTQDTSSLETIIDRYKDFDEHFNVKRKKNYNKIFLNFSGYPLRKIVDPTIITKKFDIYTRLIGVVCSVDEIRRPNSHSLPLIYYTILIRRSLIYLFGCQQDQIFDFFKQVRILPVNKVDTTNEINSPYLLKKTMLGFLWDVISKYITSRTDNEHFKKYVQPFLPENMPQGFEIISKKQLSTMISDTTKENLQALLFYQEKNTTSMGYAGVHKIGTDSEENWCARAVYEDRIYYYKGDGFTSKTIGETTRLVEQWFTNRDTKNTPFRYVDSESLLDSEQSAEERVKKFWEEMGFSTPQKDVSELFTSQTEEPEKILQNTRVNIRLLDCDSFPAYHFLNYLGREWTKMNNNTTLSEDVVKYSYKIEIKKEITNGSNLKKVGSWITHIDIIQQLLQIKWVDDVKEEIKRSEATKMIGNLMRARDESEINSIIDDAKKKNILNVTDNQGRIALIIATDLENKSMVELLLNSGAKVNIQNDGGLTALMLAAKKGNVEIMSLLLENGADKDKQTTSGSTALKMANGPKDKMIELLNKYNK